MGNRNRRNPELSQASLDKAYEWASAHAGRHLADAYLAACSAIGEAIYGDDDDGHGPLNASLIAREVAPSCGKTQLRIAREIDAAIDHLYHVRRIVGRQVLDEIRRTGWRCGPPRQVEAVKPSKGARWSLEDASKEGSGLGKLRLRVLTPLGVGRQAGGTILVDSYRAGDRGVIAAAIRRARAAAMEFRKAHER